MYKSKKEAAIEYAKAKGLYQTKIGKAKMY